MRFMLKLDMRLRGRTEQARIALDVNTIAAFKARYGWRWKLAINAALREWVKTHSAA